MFSGVRDLFSFFLYGFFQGGVGRTTDAKKCTTKKDIDGREREAEIEREGESRVCSPL